MHVAGRWSIDFYVSRLFAPGFRNVVTAGLLIGHWHERTALLLGTTKSKLRSRQQPDIAANKIYFSYTHDHCAIWPLVGTKRGCNADHLRTASVKFAKTSAVELQLAGWHDNVGVSVLGG